MREAARVFAEATRLVGDAMLLVTPAGEILAANRAAAAELGLGPEAGRGRPLLADLAPGGAEEGLRRALRAFSGAGEPQPATVFLRARGGGAEAREYRCEGARFRPGPGGPALLQLRLRPKGEAVRSFALLARQLDDLNREIQARRRFEAELSRALEAEARLVRELQHRVGEHDPGRPQPAEPRAQARRGGGPPGAAAAVRGPRAGARFRAEAAGGGRRPVAGGGRAAGARHRRVPPPRRGRGRGGGRGRAGPPAA